MEGIEELYRIFDSTNIRAEILREAYSKAIAAFEKLSAMEQKGVLDDLRERYDIEYINDWNDADQFYLYMELCAGYAPDEEKLQRAAFYAEAIYDDPHDLYACLRRCEEWYEAYPGTLSVKTKFYLHKVFRAYVKSICKRYSDIQKIEQRGTFYLDEPDDDRCILLIQKTGEAERLIIAKLLEDMTPKQKAKLMIIHTNDRNIREARIPFFASKSIGVEPEPEVEGLRIGDMEIPMVVLPGERENPQILAGMIEMILELTPGHIIHIGRFSLLAALLNSFHPVTTIDDRYLSLTAYQAVSKDYRDEDMTSLAILLGTVVIDKEDILRPKGGLPNERDVGVSLVIAAYNEEEHLNRCLASAVMQTIGHERFEIICVDDASSDRTPQLLHSWEMRYPGLFRMIYFDTNHKAAKAYNEALNYVRGTYIAYIGADDWVDIHLYQDLYDVAVTYDVDVVGGVEDMLVDETGKTLQQVPRAKHPIFNKPVYIRTPEDRLRMLQDGFSFGMSCAIRKTSVIRDNNVYYPENLVFHDNYFSAIFEMVVGSYYAVNRRYVYWYANPNGITSRKNDPRMWDRLTIEEMILEEYKRRGWFDTYYEYTRRIFIQHYYYNTIYMITRRFEAWQPERVEQIAKRVLEVYPEINEGIDFAREWSNPIEFQMLTYIHEDPRGEKWLALAETMRNL